jgi:hypothetical protein
VTSPLRELISGLESSLLELREEHGNAFANDLFSAVEDLVDLGRRILAGDSRVNYPLRVRQEQELWRRLDNMFQIRPSEDMQRYQSVFDTAHQVLLIAEKAETPKDGHLGFLKIVREEFRFLQTDYGFAITSEEPVRIRFSSSRVYVELAWTVDASSSCSFGSTSNPAKRFWTDDLLFLYGDKRYTSLQDLALDTQNAVRHWIAFLASVFRQYGRDVLSNRRDIFDDLAAAQEARDREYTEDMYRRCGVRSDLT